MTDQHLTLFSPAIALSLDPAIARAFLDAHDGGGLLPRKVTSLAVARALWGRRVPVRLARALAELARLATNAGRDALVEAAKDLGVECATWEEETPADLAARLLTLVARGKKGRWEALFERAHIRIARLMPEFPTVERVGKEARALGGTERVAKELRAALGEAFVDVWTCEEDDGTFQFAVLARGPAEPVVSANGSRLSREVVRRLQVAELSLLVSDARLRISTARQQHVSLHARALGAALYGDPAFFWDEPSLDLEWLLALRSPKREARSVPGLAGTVKVIACQLEGQGGRVEARGQNPLEKILPHLEDGGTFGRATLRFEVEGAPWDIDVIAELPDKVSITGAPRPFLRAVRGALATLGLFASGGGTAGDDITTLMPPVPEWRWRELVGEEGVARMKREARLARVEGRDSRRAGAPEYRRVGRAAVAFELKNAGDKERHYLVGDDWTRAAVTVREEDLVRWQLDLARLLGAMREDLGLVAGEALPLPLPKGVLYVGDLRCASGTARVFYLVRAVRGKDDEDAIVSGVQTAGGLGKPVLLVPAGRKMVRDVLQLELGLEEQLGTRDVRGRLRPMVEALGVVREVEAWRLVDPDVMYVIDEKQERVWILWGGDRGNGRSGVQDDAVPGKAGGRSGADEGGEQASVAGGEGRWDGEQDGRAGAGVGGGGVRGAGEGRAEGGGGWGVGVGGEQGVEVRRQGGDCMRFQGVSLDPPRARARARNDSDRRASEHPVMPCWT